MTYITNSRFANTISNSLSNIKAHYDLSNGMFAAFLSKDMTYSCGIFADLDGDLKDRKEIGDENGGIGLKRLVGKDSQEQKNQKEGEDELEAAQYRKIQCVDLYPYTDYLSGSV